MVVYGEGNRNTDKTTKPDHSETTHTQFLQLVHTEKKHSKFPNHLASVIRCPFIIVVNTLFNIILKSHGRRESNAQL
jgi:hypothetical protein